MALVELRFQLKASDEVSPNKAAVLDAIMKIIKENSAHDGEEYVARKLTIARRYGAVLRVPRCGCQRSA